MDLFNICAIRLKISCTSSFGVLWLRLFCHPDLTAISSLDFASISVISIPENSFLLAVICLLHRSASVWAFLKMSGDSNFFWEVCAHLTWSLPYSSGELNESFVCLLWSLLCCCGILSYWQFFCCFFLCLKCVWRALILYIPSAVWFIFSNTAVTCYLSHELWGHMCLWVLGQQNTFSS